MDDTPFDDLNTQLAAIPPVTYPLDDTPEAAFEHSRRLGLVAAICCEGFRRRGLTAVLVGGGVIEFVLPGAYTTPDIDLVVSRRWLRPPRDLVNQVFAQLGFRCNGARHWVRDGWFVEVPDWELTDPTVTIQVGGHQLEMVLPEVVLVGRLVEFDQTGHTGHGAQALLMLDVLGSAIDEGALGRLAATERVIDVPDAFRALLATPERPTITDELLGRVRNELLARRRERATRGHGEGSP